MSNDLKMKLLVMMRNLALVGVALDAVGLLLNLVTDGPNVEFFLKVLALHLASVWLAMDGIDKLKEIGDE